MTHTLVHQYINNKEETQNQRINFGGVSVKAVTVRHEHYIVVVPKARCTSVRTKERFFDGLKHAKAWTRRRRRTEQEA
jgi:hypothetical protein